MGLAASQARYIFITQRKITLEGALMANSNKQIRLAQESSELAEEKNDALNQKQWEFNGNADFNYDMMMGDSAMNSDKGLYMVMTGGQNSQVVLNAKYAKAMQAAGVPQKGGNYSDTGFWSAAFSAILSEKTDKITAQEISETATSVTAGRTCTLSGAGIAKEIFIILKTSVITILSIPAT